MAEGTVGEAKVGVDVTEDGICLKCGKKWDVYHDAEAKLMPVLTTDSVLALIIGPKGKGKTFFSIWLAWAVMHFPHTNWHVISNVVFGRFKGMLNNQPQDDPEAIADYDRVPPPHPKMHVATDYVELFRLVSELMVEARQVGRKIHILFIMDEAPVGGVGSRNIQGNKDDIRKETMGKLLTLTRKLTMSVVMIALHEKMVGTWFREDERLGGIGLVRVVFSKYDDEIRGVASDSVKKYGEKYEYAYDIEKIPMNQLVAVRINDDPTFNDSLLRINPCSIAKPVPMLKIGDINYDTFGIAGWHAGELNGKLFNFEDLLKRVVDSHSSDIPAILYEYFHKGDEPLTEEDKAEADDASENVEPEQIDDLARQVARDMAQPKEKRSAPKLLKLQAEVNADREVMQRTGHPKYRFKKGIAEAVPCSVQYMDKCESLGQINFDYREKESEESDAEDQNNV